MNWDLDGKKPDDWFEESIFFLCVNISRFLNVIHRNSRSSLEVFLVVIGTGLCFVNISRWLGFFGHLSKKFRAICGNTDKFSDFVQNKRPECFSGYKEKGYVKLENFTGFFLTTFFNEKLPKRVILFFYTFEYTDFNWVMGLTLLSKNGPTNSMYDRVRFSNWILRRKNLGNSFASFTIFTSVKVCKFWLLVLTDFLYCAYQTDFLFWNSSKKTEMDIFS